MRLFCGSKCVLIRLTPKVDYIKRIFILYTINGNPVQAAMASAAAFISGGILPFLVALLAPVKGMVFYQYGFAILFLVISGTVAARIGGSNPYKSILRICLWGTIAMATTVLVGYIFGVQTT